MFEGVLLQILVTAYGCVYTAYYPGKARFPTAPSSDLHDLTWALPHPDNSLELHLEPKIALTPRHFTPDFC